MTAERSPNCETYEVSTSWKRCDSTKLKEIGWEGTTLTETSSRGANFGNFAGVPHGTEENDKERGWHGQTRAGRQRNGERIQ